MPGFTPKDKLLYFPYINVPNNNWMIRNLLYWDEIGAIVPSDYLEIPERLDKHMRDLVSAQLVKQIVPGYLDYHNFSNAFIALLETSQLAERVRNSKYGISYSSKVHIEKFGYGISRYLTKNNLAKKLNPASSDPWFIVESTTANLFMSYLAAFLGNLDEVNMQPVTDKVTHLATFAADYPSATLQEHVYLDQMRLEVLNNIFPMPVTTIQVSAIDSFKQKYGDRCQSLRKKVETKIIELSYIESPQEREWKLNRFKTTLTEEIKEIEARMKERNWGKIIFGTFCGLTAAAIPGVKAIITDDIGTGLESIPGLIGALYSAYEMHHEKQKAILESPLAYAAYFNTSFHSN